jgi:dTDP-4-dehydrorhamnose 3,5-epimerase-like enzyme
MNKSSMEFNSMPTPYFISGDAFCDQRGQVRFVNDFEFDGVTRMYLISPSDVGAIRAWQGHRVEWKYFFCTQGRFLVNIVHPDTWVMPSTGCEVASYVLDDSRSEVLVVPPGNVNGISAQVEKSKLLVFSSLSVGNSLDDDYRWPTEYFHKAKW